MYLLDLVLPMPSESLYPTDQILFGKGEVLVQQTLLNSFKEKQIRSRRLAKGLIDHRPIVIVIGFPEGFATGAQRLEVGIQLLTIPDELKVLDKPGSELLPAYTQLVRYTQSRSENGSQHTLFSQGLTYAGTSDLIPGMAVLLYNVTVTQSSDSPSNPGKF